MRVAFKGRNKGEGEGFSHTLHFGKGEREGRGSKKRER